LPWGNGYGKVARIPFAVRQGVLEQRKR